MSIFKFVMIVVLCSLAAMFFINTTELAKDFNMEQFRARWLETDVERRKRTLPQVELDCVDGVTYISQHYGVQMLAPKISKTGEYVFCENEN